MNEHDIERYLTRSVEGIGGYSIKLESVSARGLPDRLILAPNHLGLVELKTRTGRLTGLQSWWAATCRRLQIPHTIIRSTEEVDDYVVNIMEES